MCIKRRFYCDFTVVCLIALTYEKWKQKDDDDSIPLHRGFSLLNLFPPAAPCQQPDKMPKKTNERLEELKIAHETLEMMIQLIKDLGFEPPLETSQYQETIARKAATLHDERLIGIYQGYASMFEEKERLKIKINSLIAQDAEILGAAEKKASAKEQSGPQQKKTMRRRAKRRGDPWDLPRKRRRQLEFGKEKISKSPLSSEIGCNGITV